MIKFFRQIRYSLMEQNKTGRYFKYAVGEIILVVIGILLALQINNWNENKKNTVVEQKYLISMLEDFERNLERSEYVINEIEEILPALINLIDQSSFESPTISVDSLNKAFSTINNMPFYSSTDRVYNNLIGSGDLKIIKNDELKTKLSMYYKILYILNQVQNTHELELVESFQPYILDHMDFQAVYHRRVPDFPLPKPIEKNKILEVLNTREFRNILTLKWTILTDILAQNRSLKKINLEIVDQLTSMTRVP